MTAINYDHDKYVRYHNLVKAKMNYVSLSTSSNCLLAIALLGGTIYQVRKVTLDTATTQLQAG
jgi:hypothetical protein